MKYDKINNIFYSTEQDCWIFNVPLDIQDCYINELKNIYFYNRYSELIFNMILKKNNYILLNDTKKYKIFRILHENNLENRLLLTEKTSIKNDEIYLLPENDSFDKVSLEQFIKYLNLDDKELYLLKCELFNKYSKNKIVENI
jgi:hypothetical protein